MTELSTDRCFLSTPPFPTPPMVGQLRYRSAGVCRQAPVSRARRHQHHATGQGVQRSLTPQMLDNNLSCHVSTRTNTHTERATLEKCCQQGNHVICLCASVYVYIGLSLVYHWVHTSVCYGGLYKGNGFHHIMTIHVNALSCWLAKTHAIAFLFCRSFLWVFSGHSFLTK